MWFANKDKIVWIGRHVYRIGGDVLADDIKGLSPADAQAVPLADGIEHGSLVLAQQAARSVVEDGSWSRFYVLAQKFADTDLADETNALRIGLFGRS